MKFSEFSDLYVFFDDDNLSEYQKDNSSGVKHCKEGLEKYKIEEFQKALGYFDEAVKGAVKNSPDAASVYYNRSIAQMHLGLIAGFKDALEVLRNYIVAHDFTNAIMHIDYIRKTFPSLFE